MTDQFQDLKEYWKILEFLPEDEKVNLLRDIKTFQFEPGQKLHQIDELPPGLIRIVDGKVRLITHDESNEPFTLQKYKKGDFIGGLHLIRGPSKLYHSASTKLIIEVLKAEKFLNLIEKYPKILVNYSKVEAWELFDIFDIKEINKDISYIKKSKWAESYSKKNEIKAIFTKDNASFEIGKDKYIVSSQNIKNHPKGYIFQSPFQFEVLGRLPARFIKLKEDLNFSKDNYNFEDEVKFNHKDLKRCLRRLVWKD